MSVRLMARVFDLRIRAVDKLVLLAMADHARDDGTGCYPSITLLAKKTSLTYRGIHKILHRLLRTGFVLKCGISELSTVEYALTLENGRPETRPVRRRRGKGPPEHGSAPCENSFTLPLNLVPSGSEPGNTPPLNTGAKSPEPRSDEPSRTKNLTKNRKPTAACAAESPHLWKSSARSVDESTPVLSEPDRTRMQMQNLLTAKGKSRMRPVERLDLTPHERLTGEAMRIRQRLPGCSHVDLKETLKEWAARNLPGFDYGAGAPGKASPIEQAISAAEAIDRRRRRA